MEFSKRFPFIDFLKPLNILFKKYARKLCSRKKSSMWCVCFPKTLWAVVVTTIRRYCIIYCTILFYHTPTRLD